MKPTQDELKAIFGQTPQGFTRALHQALSPADAPRRRPFAWRTALIAALILVCTAAAAYAIGARLGLLGYWQANYNIQPAPQTQSQLQAGPVQTFDLGPIKITLQESLADGQIVYIACLAETMDGSPALFRPPNEDDVLSYPSLRQQLGLPEGTTYAQAAQQLGWPLYQVAAYPSLAPGMKDGDEMMDCQWDEKSRVVMIHMLSTKEDQVGETLPLTLSLLAQEIDPTTGEAKADCRWEAEETVTLPVGGVMAEKTYHPAEEAQVGEFTLQSLRARQTSAGVYVDITFTAPQGTVEDSFNYFNRLTLTNGQGEPLPIGVSLSGGWDDSAAPTLILKKMMTLDALPETMYVTVMDSQRNIQQIVAFH